MRASLFTTAQNAVIEAVPDLDDQDWRINDLGLSMISHVTGNDDVWYHRFRGSDSYQLISNIRTTRSIIAKCLVKCYPEIERDRRMIR